MSRDQANKYRYLEGVQCDSFTPAVIVAALVAATDFLGSSLTCMNKTDTMPCCPQSFVAGSFKGQALGCLRWVPGLFLERRVYSTEEAVETFYPDTHNVHQTGICKHAN